MRGGKKRGVAVTWPESGVDSGGCTDKLYVGTHKWDNCQPPHTRCSGQKQRPAQTALAGSCSVSYQEHQRRNEEYGTSSQACLFTVL